MAFILLTISGFAQLGWVKVPSPNPSSSRNMVGGISGTSSSDIWVVGSYEEPQYVQNDLLLHWNGSAWQQFPALHLSTSLDDLRDVEAISANDVWAVGAYNDNATTRAELLHYDGTSWTNQPLPFITGGSWFDAIHAVSPTDIWAVGGKSGSPTRPPYVMRYNGSSWTEMTVPTTAFRTYFLDVHGISSNDVWAVGHTGTGYGDFHALAMHWNGSSWSNLSLPSSVVTPLSEILSVKMISANDVWAVGYFLTGGMFKIHWDGSTWTDITPPNGGGGAFAALSTNNVFSVGGKISHWDGSTWTIVDQLSQLSSPSLSSTVVFANGEIWAAGNTSDPNSFSSLIYRSVNHTPLFAGGTTQPWNVGANTNNNSPGSLLLTSDNDVSQILTYSIITPPAHGVLGGLPATAITNSSSATPTGITYTPVSGYAGPDQFVLRVAAGTVYSETTINVNVLLALPVTLLDFQVTAAGTHALLKWNTASESNTQKFEIEHSTDGIRFTAAGTTTAQGNSPGITSYSFIHHLPVPGRNYYRLKLYTLDGRIEFFPVKYVQFEAGMLKPVTLLSNPVQNGMVNLQVNTKGLYQLSIYNQQGQQVAVKSINNTAPGTRYLIDLPQTASGIYMLNVTNGQEQYTFKLLVH